LHWTVPDDDGCEPIEEYQIEAYISNQWVKVADNPPVTVGD